MSVKLVIKDFQSIKQSVIDIEGVTCMVASNNEGKSAHIRAIKALICNASNVNHIRVGANCFSVGVITSKGDKIKYSRGKAVTYKVNDTDFEKLNRDCLSQIFPESGFIYDKLLDVSILPQFVFQGELSFPFCLNSSQIYSVFSRFFGIEELEGVLKSVNGDVREFKQDLKYAQGVVDTLKLAVSSKKTVVGGLPSKESLSGLATTLQNAQDSLNLAVSLLRLRQERDGLKSSLQELTSRESALQGILGQLTPLLPPIDSILTEIKALEESLLKYRSLRAELDRHLQKFKDLDKIQSLLSQLISKEETVKNSLDILEVIKRYNDEIGSLARLNDQEAQLNSTLGQYVEELGKFPNCPFCTAPVKDGKYIAN